MKIIIKYFIKFLQNKKCYAKFIKEIYYDSTIKNINNLYNILYNSLPEAFLIKTFNLDCSIYGYEFWDNINYEWRKLYNKVFYNKLFIKFLTKYDYKSQYITYINNVYHVSLNDYLESCENYAMPSFQFFVAWNRYRRSYEAHLHKTYR